MSVGRTPADPDAARAAAELGEPLAAFTAAAGWLKAKYAAAVGLILFGAAANYFWWVHGPGRAGNFEVHLLVVPIIVGVGLLFHLVRNRGLVVLIFETGILRVRRGEVEAFPWAEISDVRLKADAATFRRDADAAWFEVAAPAVQVWNGWVEITGADGRAAKFSAVLGNYAELAEMVLRGTFAAQYLAAAETVAAGGTARFGEFGLAKTGISNGKLSLPWAQVGEVAVSQKSLAVKRPKAWLPWGLRPLPDVPFPHVFAALAEVLRPAAAVDPPAEEG